MFRLKLTLFIALFLAGFSYTAFSQITITPSVGCAPLNNVSFTPPPGATTFTWNFGDSSGPSNISSPSHNYNAAGNYTVTFSGIVSGSPATFTALVIAAASPTASFTYTVPSIHCKPLNVSFTSTSTGPNASMSYTWNFGDGGQNNSTGTPVYTYGLQGSFYVTLLVKDNVTGCTSTVSPQQGPINVSTPPIVVISSNPLALTSCTAPFTAAFSASNCVSGSPISGPLSSYSWNFGNTQTSSLLTPGNITYNTPGVYNVSLTVTDNNNCSGFASTPVSVSQPTISATIPGTVCLNTTFTMSYQSNQPSTNWTFGTGPSSVITTSTVGPTTFSTHVYTTPGTYTINITAGVVPCLAIITKTIYVEQVVANFTFTPPSLTCSPTFTTAYINQSSPNAINYTWTTTNGANVTATSTAANPTFTFTNGSLNPYTIYQPYQQNVVLVVQSANGCFASVSHQYPTIHRPTAWFNKDKSEGCAPLTVTFRDSSFFNPLFPITSYTWNNGGTPTVTASGPAPPIPNFVFTYTAAGTYTPYLIIQTAGGCIDTSFIDVIHVANPPPIAFTFTPTGNVCWNQTFTVNATSTATPPLQHWHVNTDDGFFSGCVNDPNPTWQFTHTGTHTISVDGYLYGCKNTQTTSATINILGPIGQSRYQTNCNPGTRKTINFYSQLQDVATATLNFGDNASVNITGTPGGVATHTASHTYTASGNYTASLVSQNPANPTCGTNTYTMLVTVRDIHASYTYSSLGCAAVTQTYDASSSTDVFTGCNKRGYMWFFDNTPPRDTAMPVITHTFATTGIHTVLLMVRDENSCMDTVKHTIRISNASPTFTFNNNPICLSSGSVQIINTTSQLPDAVNNYIWDFGDGTPTVNATAPIHIYTSANIPSQNYTVTVVATNVLSCVDSIKHVITVVNPNAAISPSWYYMCIPTSTANMATNTLTFTAPPAYTSYTFSYGDGSPQLATTNSIAVHTFTTPGSYTVGLTVDIGGCRNSNSVVVTAQPYPIPNFSLNPSSICKGAQVQFSNTSTISSIYNPIPHWDLSTGSPIIPSDNVVWTYTATGSAVITLTVETNPNLCASVISKTLNIFGVKAHAQLDKQVVCLGNAIKFSLKNDSSTVNSWNWDFGDGSVDSAYISSSPSHTIVHTYTNFPLPNGNTYIQFTGWSSQHRCSDTMRIPIKVIKIDGAFNRNNEVTRKDSVHCVNVIDQFSNQTPNSTGYTFNWNFGDGIGNSTAQNPTYTYPNAGVYTVTLNITDPVNNCLGFAVKNMTINPLPVAAIQSKDSICQSATFTLSSMATIGTPAFSYTWSPSANLISPNNFSSTATASNSTTYTLLIQDANGCKNSTTRSIYIQLPPPHVQWDTAVVIGQLSQLNNNSGSNFTYTWSPATNLSCIYCPNPTSTSTVNITYTVTVADNLGCFKTTNTYTIDILPKSSVDVPTAFTPNGDGTNDVIYVDGWGIRKLNYFRIFNRWGQLLFESNDIKVGWDGLFNGVPQNVETYVYQVSVETYIDAEPQLKTGSFKLIR